MARINAQSNRSEPAKSSGDQTGAFDGSPLQAGNSPADVTPLPDSHAPSVANEDATTFEPDEDGTTFPAGREDVTTFEAGDQDVTTFQSDDEDVTTFQTREEDVTTFQSPEEDVTTFRSPDDDVTTFKSPETPSATTHPRATKPPTETSRTRSGSKAAKSGAQGPIEVGQSFGSRYHIIKVLGVGGMGAVYQAWDAELGVAVALKVIRPEITADPTAAQDIERRFKRELLLARQVTHPNVVRIHDLGDIDGIKYITMHFIEGADLATILNKDTKLPIPRALCIARGIVAGLVSAHQAGVVHRDLKPANIMVAAEDTPTIMDFGIARSAGGPALGKPAAVTLPTEISRTAAAAASSTVAGAIVGTVAYMAPEQARGEEVDQRADIYAFGLILYDMVVGGRRSERAASAIAELQARMQQAPPAPRTIDASIPEAVDALIRRCLEPDAAKRFQTTVELQHALERLDDQGKPLPIYRRVSRRAMVAAVAGVVLLLAGTFYTANWLATPVKEPDPVSVVIADFQNSTNDPTFNNALGPTVRRALEDASFISAYDRSRMANLGVRQSEKLDEVAARELALKQGLGVVLAGSIAPSGGGYEITVKAAQTITGEEIESVSDVASSKDKVLETATRLVTRVRKALGDRTSESDQLFAMRTLSTSSLDVVSHYASAVEAQSRGKFEEARVSYLRAIELDPKFGLGYQGLAAMLTTLGRRDEAEKYIKEALRYVDGLTARERFFTRGFYYRFVGDYRQCAKEYAELLAQYPADSAARAQRAACLANVRNIREAADEMRQAVQMLPNHLGYRVNFAIIANRAGDFQTADDEVKAMEQPDTRALLALAYSQIARGLSQEATETYKRMGAQDPRSPWPQSGVADVLVYQGRFSEGAKIFEQDAAADLAAKNSSRAAIKLTSMAYAHLMAGQIRPAAAAAEQALEHGTGTAVKFMAGEIFVETGALDKAAKLAAELSSSTDLSDEARTHGKILEAEIALKKKDPRQAIKILTEANTVLDTWLGHFTLGRAYFDAGVFVQADSEFDVCFTRRGEALSLMDEGPSFGRFPIVYYYQGRVREELKTASFANSYREYLNIRGASSEDPIVRDIRKRGVN